MVILTLYVSPKRWGIVADLADLTKQSFSVILSLDNLDTSWGLPYLRLVSNTFDV